MVPGFVGRNTCERKGAGPAGVADEGFRSKKEREQGLERRNEDPRGALHGDLGLAVTFLEEACVPALAAKEPHAPSHAGSQVLRWRVTRRPSSCCWAHLPALGLPAQGPASNAALWMP